MDLVIELWKFLGTRKKFWLLPMILLFVIAGTLMVLAEGSTIAPFIYTLF
jgi:Family of unknown function (DUF5989)